LKTVVRRSVGVGKVRVRGRLSSGCSGAEGKRGTNVAGRRASGRAVRTACTVCVHPAGMRRSFLCSLVSRTVDSPKINLSP